MGKNYPSYLDYALKDNPGHFNKPPLGLMPHKFWVEERITNILQAVNRYIEDDREIPTEWIEEYNKLIQESREIK